MGGEHTSPREGLLSGESSVVVAHTTVEVAEGKVKNYCVLGGF